MRSYMKIQDLFAKLGGIANALMLLASILSYHYLRFSYINFVYNHTFNLLDIEKIKSNSEEKKRRSKLLKSQVPKV